MLPSCIDVVAMKSLQASCDYLQPLKAIFITSGMLLAWVACGGAAWWWCGRGGGVMHSHLSKRAYPNQVQCSNTPSAKNTAGRAATSMFVAAAYTHTQLYWAACVHYPADRTHCCTTSTWLTNYTPWLDCQPFHSKQLKARHCWGIKCRWHSSTPQHS